MTIFQWLQGHKECKFFYTFCDIWGGLISESNEKHIRDGENLTIVHKAVIRVQ
jgi:hypothetical protein